MVSATDGSGNGPAGSQQASFQNTPPVIVAGPLLSDVTDSEATIIWSTDEASVSGLTLYDGEHYEVYSDETLTQDHEIRLTQLESETRYYYTVSVTHHSAQVRWRLDEPATGVIEYGLSPQALTQTVVIAKLNTNNVRSIVQTSMIDHSAVVEKQVSAYPQTFRRSH